MSHPPLVSVGFQPVAQLVARHIQQSRCTCATGRPCEGRQQRPHGDDERAKVGDVITIKGTLRTDKDFGSGYSHAVIVEEASIVK